MMTPVRNKVLAFAFAFAFGFAACGANGMTLVEVYERALQEDAAIRAARATLSATNERLPQARAQLMPSVQASLSRNYNDLDTTTPNAFGQQTTTNSAYVSSGKTLTMRMPLYNAQRYFEFEQAKDVVEDAQATYERGVQDLMVRVGGGVYGGVAQPRATKPGVVSKNKCLDTARCGDQSTDLWSRYTHRY